MRWSIRFSCSSCWSIRSSTIRLSACSPREHARAGSGWWWRRGPRRDPRRRGRPGWTAYEGALGGEAETGAARAVGGSIGPSKSLQSYLDLVETMGHEAKTQDRDEDGGDPFPWVAIGSDVLLGLL